MSHRTQTYSGIASGCTDAPSTPRILSSSFPNKCEDSATDFINYIFAFENKYFAIIVFNALQKALPALQVAHSNVPDSVGAFMNALISKLDMWRYL